MLADSQAPEGLPRAVATLERTLILRSDSQDVLNYFCSAYRRALVPVPEEMPCCDTGSILERDGTNWLYFNGQPAQYAGEKPPTSFRLAFYGSSKLVRLSIRRNTAWWSLYSAALRLGDRAIIISAATGIGKTTLALELLSRGAKFYSDEFAFIRKSDGVVSGLARTLLIRERTFPLLRNERLRRVCEASAPRTQRGDRVWDNIDAGDLFGEDVFAEPAPLAAAIMLGRCEGPAQIERVPGGLAAMEFAQRLNTATEGFERLLATAEMLARAPCYRIAAQSPSQAADEIERLIL